MDGRARPPRRSRSDPLVRAEHPRRVLRDRGERLVDLDRFTSPIVFPPASACRAARAGCGRGTRSHQRRSPARGWSRVREVAAAAIPRSRRRRTTRRRSRRAHPAVVVPSGSKTAAGTPASPASVRPHALVGRDAVHRDDLIVELPPVWQPRRAGASGTPTRPAPRARCPAREPHGMPARPCAGRRTSTSARRRPGGRPAPRSPAGSRSAPSWRGRSARHRLHPTGDDQLCPPARIIRSAISIARTDEAHTLLMVSADLLRDPAPTAACRAGACPAPACSTWPMITYSTSSASTPARSSLARITIEPSSVAGCAARPPPRRPNGVRTAETMTERLTRPA